MPDFGLMLVVALGVGVFVYFQMNQAIARRRGETKNAYKDGNKAQKYIKFCNKIECELSDLKTLITKEQNLLLSVDVALEKLSNLNKKIVFIETMSSRSNSEEDWEARIFEFLQSVESFIEETFVNSDALKDSMRERLWMEFASL